LDQLATLLLPPWSASQELYAPDGANGDFFGYSVAIDAYTGGTLLIGAPQDKIGGNAGQGSAWVFIRYNNGFSIQEKLTAAGGGAGDNFGWSVAVEGYTSGRAVVGAPHGGSTNQGVAYIFRRNNALWIQELALAPADGARGDEFGHVVAINITGNRMAVGAPFDDIGANTDQGSVYLYEVGTPWSFVAKLIAFDGAAGDGFGWSVSINGPDVVVGAPYNDVGTNTDQGSAYLFVCGSVCTLSQKLTSITPSAGDLFGMSVSIDPAGANTIMVGEPWGDRYYRYPVALVYNSGAAYAFTL
jgi:hypothetical protein